MCQGKGILMMLPTEMRSQRRSASVRAPTPDLISDVPRLWRTKALCLWLFFGKYANREMITTQYGYKMLNKIFYCHIMNHDQLVVLCVVSQRHLQGKYKILTFHSMSFRMTIRANYWKCAHVKGTGQTSWKISTWGTRRARPFPHQMGWALSGKTLKSAWQQGSAI